MRRTGRMSPRRTRAAAISTRSKAQKEVEKNASQDVAISVQRTRQRKKSVAAKQSTKKQSPDIEVSVIKSTKKTSRRRLNLDKVAETKDTSVVQKGSDVDSNSSIALLRNKYCDSIAMVELVRTDLAQMNTSKNSEKMSNGKLQQKTSVTNVKSSPLVITPKSTPPKLSLTPHRSKKTPKKSPISLGSPKTHSIAIPKLLKSPRKLSLVVAGNNSNSADKKASPKAKSERKKSGINLKRIVHKFSKSPKIVLRSPKSKSKSRKSKLSSSQMSRSLVKESPTSPCTKLNFDNAKLSKISTKESPFIKKKNLSQIKQRLLNPKIMKTLSASQIKDVCAEPVVLLEKLSPETVKRKYTLMTTSKNRSNSLPKIGYCSVSIRRESNFKVLTPVKKVSLSKSPKRNSSTKLRNNSMEKLQISNINRISPRIKHNTSIQEDKSSVPLMSSTPREEKMIFMDTSLSSNTSIASINNTSLNSRSRSRNQSNVQLSSTIDKNTDIENVSEPSLFDQEINTSQSRFSSAKNVKQDVTYDKDNKIEESPKNSKDNTYELEQPHTSNLRQMINKRTVSDANLNMSLKDTVKKTKVRFANVTSDSDSEQKSINKLNGSSILDNISTHSNNVISSAHKSKKETSKFIRNSLISSNKRSSLRSMPQAQLSKIQITPKTIAPVEKKSEKKSSTKKVPNFGRIHEQMFAKSESLVDVKKRLAARHSAFTTNKTPKADMKTEGKKPLPTDTKDGVHNRFGFKLKKPEATHLVLKKHTVFSREKQQNETRLMLQGVRINRRFELQMKARNLNP